jgi:putative transposase
MEPKKTYHIYTHANGSENLFQTNENFRYFLKRYEEYIPPVADTLAWCLMPNHLHLRKCGSKAVASICIFRQ